MDVIGAQFGECLECVDLSRLLCVLDGIWSMGMGWDAINGMECSFKHNGGNYMNEM